MSHAATAANDRRRSEQNPRDIARGGRRISDLKSHPANFVTVPGFAAYLGVRPKTVKKWINAGALVAFRFGLPLVGEWRIRKEDAIDFVERSRFVPAADSPEK